MIRKPAVANKFYPGNETELRSMLTSFIANNEEQENVKALVMPHAGYVYSGATAGQVVSTVKVPESVILLGPNHYGIGEKVAVSSLDWQIPGGTISLDRELANLIVDSNSNIRFDDSAHAQEHSLEVLLPFLHFKNPLIRIVPVSVSHLSYEECVNIADILALSVKKNLKPVQFVASTDMSHFLSRENTNKLDGKAIERMLAFDPEGLFNTVKTLNISMCGMLPTVITMLAVKQLGATTVKLVDYTDSGEVNGDTRKVVGYAGLTIH